QRFQGRSGGCDVESVGFGAHQADHSVKAAAKKRSSFSREGDFLIASAVSRPPLLELESGRICAGSRAHFRSPTEFFQQRIIFSFYSVGNDLTQHRGKCESVSAVTRGND